MIITSREVVLLLGGFRQPDGDRVIDAESERLMKILLVDLPIKQAAAIAAKVTGIEKDLYQWALNHRPEGVDKLLAIIITVNIGGKCTNEFVGRGAFYLLFKNNIGNWADKVHKQFPNGVSISSGSNCLANSCLVLDNMSIRSRVFGSISLLRVSAPSWN